MKKSVIEQFPMLARQLGEAFFNEKLNPICIDWMKDPIYTIREASLENIKQLTIVFGTPWALKNILPKLIGLHTESNYLHRLTSLFGIATLSEQLQQLPAETTKKMIMPVFNILLKDPVPNVRMNVAKTISKLYPSVKSTKEISVSNITLKVS
jgi:serine/threonine-protein phosphatase 2A regulatory subunit A